MSEEAFAHTEEDNDIKLVPLHKTEKCETAVRPNQCQESSNKDSDVGVDESICQEEEEIENKNQICHESLSVNDNNEDAFREDFDSGKNGQIVTDKFSIPGDNRPNSVSPTAALERVEIVSDSSSNDMVTKNCIQISSLNVGSDIENSVPDQNSFSSSMSNGIVLSEQNSEIDQEDEPLQSQETMATSAQESVGPNSPPKKKFKKESGDISAGLENAEVVSDSLSNDMLTENCIQISSLNVSSDIEISVPDQNSSSSSISNDTILSEQNYEIAQEDVPLQLQAASAQEQVDPDSRPKNFLKKESDESAGLENVEVVSYSLSTDMLTKNCTQISSLNAVSYMRNAVPDQKSPSTSNDVALSDQNSQIAQEDVPLQPQGTMATSVQEPIDPDSQPEKKLKKESDKKPKKRELSYCVI